jgi:hypothetical protein
MQDSWAGFCPSGAMVCILTRGSIRDSRRIGQAQKPWILCVFMGCFSEISMKYGRNGTTENQLYPYNDTLVI